MKSYHNMESRKESGKNYYSGYSEVGEVRIHKLRYKRPWTVVMGHSTNNYLKGIAGSFVGTFANLDDVSKALENLEIVEKPFANSTRPVVRVKAKAS